MKKNEMIEHQGVISELKDNSIFVELDVQSACSGCHAKGICGFDSKKKTVEVKSTENIYQIGETVTVKLRESLGMKALFLGYILPCIVLVVSLIIFISVGISEGLSGILAISILVPYYLVLYFFKDKIRKEFDFKIEKK